MGYLRYAGQMPRRSPSHRISLAISLVVGLLALGCFVAAPAMAAAENEPVTTLTTVMHNFDAQPAQTFTLALREGEVIFGGWINLTQRNGYIRYFPGTRYDERVIFTPYVLYVKKYKQRCWTRKRRRFDFTTSDSLANVDMTTVLRKSENQILYEELRDGVRSQVTVTYDTVTLLPSRFEIASQDTETGRTITLVQDVTFTTPARAPKPGRICKPKKKKR